jgi:hypothetical protein
MLNSRYAPFQAGRNAFIVNQSFVDDCPVTVRKVKTAAINKRQHLK